MSYLSLLIVSFISIVISLFIYKLKAWKCRLLTVWIIIALCGVLLLNIFWACCYYFTGEGITWAVIYTLTSSLTGVGVKSYILPGVCAIVIVVFTLWLSTKVISTNSPFFRQNKLYTILAVVFSFGALATSPVWLQYRKTVVPEVSDSGKDFYNYYIPPISVINNPKYNLVYIYAESLERTYFDDTHFPGLTADLGAIKHSGLDFSQTQQYAGMDFTIAGIVASQCGLPLFTPSGFGNNTDVTSDFFSEKICLGDILKNSGYENYFYQGANIRFANKDQFFHAHGIDHAFGLEQSKYKDDLTYQNEWGLYDNLVLQQVWDKFKTLSEAGKRFSIFTLTLDTHPPHGYIPDECKGSSYIMAGEAVPSLGAVACSQREIAKLIDRIKRSPWAKNTIVVVSSDHLAMNNTSVAIDYLKKYERHGLFFILKDGLTAGINNQPRSTMDNGATVLELLGGGNNLGLGRSTLSRTSLTKRFRNIGSKIIAWSPHVQKLWGTPLAMQDYVVDTQKETLSFDAKVYPIPLLVGFIKGKPSLLTDRRGQAPLRFKLANLSPEKHFIWVDRCFQMGNVWAKERDEIVLSPQWCKAEGTLSGNVAIEKLPLSTWNGTVQAEIPTPQSHSEKYVTSILNQLRQMNAHIRYPSDAILFYLEGVPDGVDSVTGIGARESWGRWSDAVQAPAVTVTYRDELPCDFWMNIDAKAYGKNVNEPIAIRVGDRTQYLRLGKESAMHRLHFSQVSGKTVMITPPYPELSREGNTIASPTDAPDRKIGVGLVSLKIDTIGECRESSK